MYLAYFSEFKRGDFSVTSLNLMTCLLSRSALVLPFLCSVSPESELQGFPSQFPVLICFSPGSARGKHCWGTGLAGEQEPRLFLPLPHSQEAFLAQSLCPSHLLEADTLTWFQLLTGDPGLWAPVSPLPLPVLAVHSGGNFLKLLMSGLHYLPLCGVSAFSLWSNQYLSLYFLHFTHWHSVFSASTTCNLF